MDSAFVADFENEGRNVSTDAVKFCGQRRKESLAARFLLNASSKVATDA